MSRLTELPRRGIAAIPAAALCIVACSSPSRGPNDAALPADAPVNTADASLCGNQVVDPGEQCDEGLRNGTPASRCTKQCMSGIYPNDVISRSTRLPGHTVNDLVEVQLHNGDHLAFRDKDAVYLAFRLNSNTLGNGTTPQLFTLKGAAPPTSLGSFFLEATNLAGTHACPVWLEQASARTNGVQGMYWSYLDDNDQPVIRSLPYPFADGTGGVILTNVNKWPIIVDQSSTPPYDLLIGVVLARYEDDIEFATARIPSRGRKRGALAGNRVLVDLVEDSLPMPPPMVQRIVQFYDDTHAFSQIDVRPPSDSARFSPPFSIVESASGIWPFDVATAVDWREAIADSPSENDYKALTHPNPFAVINADGSVYTWQFNATFDSNETVVAPFGQVPAGTHVAAMFEHGGAASLLWTLSPNGDVAILNDGDDANVTSTSLQAATLPAVAPWTTAALSPSFGDSYAPIAIDDTIYLGLGV